MEQAFWLQKWQERDIGFHQAKPHPLLVKHLDQKTLPKNSRVFVPLCGKSLDIGWLLSRGYRVAGCELVESAVRELFAELGVKPRIQNMGPLTLYSADGIDIFAGDFFNLTRDALGPVDMVYDRAALVALPDDMRARYAKHMILLTNNAPQLLICFEYDQTVLAGPPFSISADEVRRHYAKSHRITLLERAEIQGGLKGKCAAVESVWGLGRAC